MLIVSGKIYVRPGAREKFAEWESEEALLAFRGSCPDSDLFSSVVRAEVARHVVSSSGPP